MKIKYLFSAFRPAFKCGAADALAGITGMMSGTLNAQQSGSNVAMQLRAQAVENQLNRDWQTEQAELARQWEAGQVQQQNQFTREQAAIQNSYNLNSMKQQAMYQSPVYQREELAKAGINPNVYFGQQASFSGSSVQSGGSPATPSPGSAPGVGSVQGLNPVGFQPSSLNPADLLRGVSEAYNALASAKKTGVETSFLEASLESRIKQALAQGDMAETAKALQEIDLAFQKANFDTKLKHAYAQYKETLANIDLLSEKKLTEQEEQKLKQATAAMNKAIQELNEEEKNKLGIVIQYLPRMLESEILANRGSAAAGFGKAEESRASAAVLREEKRIRSVVANLKETGSSKELEALLSKLQADDAISQAQHQTQQNQLHDHIFQ